MSKITLSLILIVVLGAFLRLSFLDKYPPGVTGDEIQQGYTAYSILKTGRDEWGDFLPINPRGFGDYKPPAYAYLTVPFVAIMGLNEFVVRFPAALAGILAIVVIYFLAKEIFDNKKVGLFAAFLLAISPWHVQDSRIAWESNIGLLFFCLGVLFLLKSFKENKYLIHSTVFLGLTTLTYHSFKVFVIIFVISVFYFYRKNILGFQKKYLQISFGILLVFGLIVANGYIFSGAGRRASDAAIYNEENILKLRQVQIVDALPQPWGRVINNKIQFIGSEFLNNYAGYFSTSFLFSPNREAYSIFNFPGKGLLYIWEIGLLIAAIYFIGKEKPKWLPLIILWVLLAPVPASLTRDYMHAGRVQTLLIIFPILSAFGLAKILEIEKIRKYKNLGLGVFLAIALWSLVGRIDFYMSHTFNKNLGGLNYGYKEIVNFAEENKGKYDKIIFTKVNSEPQAFIAFYSKMDPKIYQNDSQNWKYFEKDGFKFLDMINFNLEKYEFRNINWNEDKKLVNTLVIASDKELPDDVVPIFVVKDNKDRIVFQAVQTGETN